MSRKVTHTRTKQRSLFARSTTDQSPRRRRRHRDRRRQRRREEFLREVVATVTPAVLSPDDAIRLFCGGLTAARYTLKRLRRTEAAQFPLAEPLQALAKTGLSRAVRPVRELSRLNRSSTFPAIVEAKVPIDLVRASDVLALLRGERRSEPPHRLLDLFALGTGLSYELSAEILFAEQLIPMPMTGHQIAAVKNARFFWDQYWHGRTRFAALAGSGYVPQFRGDWAYFDHPELEGLLPGIVVRGPLKRYDYLTNYRSETSGFCLDVYAASNAAPLFQHQFPDRFNPLHFGGGINSF